MKNYILFALIITGIGCKNTTLSEENNTKPSNNNAINQSQTDEIEISKLIFMIDSIYNIEGKILDSIRLDTVKAFVKTYTFSSDEFDTSRVIRSNQLDDPLYAFSPEKAEYIYKYGTYSMIKFNEDTTAKRAFMKVFYLFQNDYEWIIISGDSIRLFYDVFSKGGSTYFYKSNLIIHKYRRCNDNYKDHEGKENMLVDYLYHVDSIKEPGYFMRFCCSCPFEKAKEYR